MIFYLYMHLHCCIVECKFPDNYPHWKCRDSMRDNILPTLHEFGYILPEEELQRRIIETCGEGNLKVSLCIYLTDEEAIKTASIRAEWKPLEPTVELDSNERKALRKMSRKKRKRNQEKSNCHICLDTCVKATTIDCDHTFCYECIKRWLSIKRNCPVCDKDINVKKYVRRKRLKMRDKKTSVK